MLFSSTHGNVLCWFVSVTLISWVMGPTRGPFGADRTQLGPVSAPWNLLSGYHIEYGRYFTDDNFQSTFSMKTTIFDSISLIFVARGPCKHAPKFVLLMAWYLNKTHIKREIKIRDYGGVSSGSHIWSHLLYVKHVNTNKPRLINISAFKRFLIQLMTIEGRWHYR